MKTWNVIYKLVNESNPLNIPNVIGQLPNPRTVQVFAETSNEAVNKAKAMTVYPFIRTNKNYQSFEPTWYLISVTEYNACAVTPSVRNIGNIRSSF